MKGKFEILMVIAVFCLPGVMSGEADSFFGRVQYAVSMPMADDDVVYDINLRSSSDPADSLLGERYLIEWQLPAAGADGFSAYFDGNFYSYRDDRLREYHYQWDSIPFLTRSGGVHRNAQFINLLPFSISEQLRQMEGDSTFTVTRSRAIADALPVCRVHAVRELHGVEALQFDLDLEEASGKPISLHQLFNPGMLGEQEISAQYFYDEEPTATPPASEEQLIALYPEIFSQFRTSNFTIENLRGMPMPGFALPTVTRERHLYNKGDRFANPMIIGLLDSSVGTTPSTIAAMRHANLLLPRQAGLIFAFVDNDIDRIEEIVGPSMIGETTLTSARSLARDTGANSFPTLILVNTDGTVSDLILGNSADLAEELLQKASLLK